MVWCDLHARPLFGKHGEIEGFVATLLDVTYRRDTERKLRNMAELDSLTGLANRALFHDRLSQAIERIDRHGPVALICIDLDDFKNINDSLGHDVGDALLKKVASRLRRCVRGEDTIARVGGDEFMVVLGGIDSFDNTTLVCEKILRLIEAPVSICSHEIFVTASIGVSFCIANDNNCIQNLMKQADIALYRAKAEGRNNFQYYSPELEHASQERLSMTNALRHAFEREEFELYFQLQADIANDGICGVETLIRWRHPEKGLLSPTDFVPLLESTGLIVPVGKWLQHKAFSIFKKWIDEGVFNRDARISINMSSHQLRDASFIDDLTQSMDEIGLGGDNITLELTESALLEETSAIKDVLQRLKQRNVQIAIDDFGTGYSSLTYLKRFPIDFIKIDQCFVRDMLDDPEDRAITQAVIGLAKSLNLQCVAEGVESQEGLKQLTEWHCDFYQGYHLNQPCITEEIEQIMFRKNQSDTNSRVI